ncbi:hypothetical protein D3C74_430880 [compost metagenome]
MAGRYAAFGQMPALHRAICQVATLDGPICQMRALYGTCLQMNTANRLLTQGCRVHRAGLQMLACNGSRLQILPADAFCGQQTALLQLRGQVPFTYGFGGQMRGIDYGLSKVSGSDTAFGQMPALNYAFT